jgi:Phage tail sheath protein subtilisin-like domain/Phage tail sheath C-terminal domain
MARSINSPGVQITETDLSQYQVIGGGTTVFVPGFASNGPTDEVLKISTISEFENIYGAPETAAERFFYYSCKEVLNSPANLLTTRLPYGSGSGAGFTTQYSALLYPVASADANSFKISAPTHISLSETDYLDLLQNNVTWQSIDNDDTTTGDYSDNTLTAGIVVLNSSQTTINGAFEGYYVSLADNTDFGPDTDFTSVNTIKSLTATDNFYPIPTARLGFALSGTKTSVGTNSVSEVIESIPTYNFGDTYYNDSLILNVFKVRNSIYEPQSLSYSLVETHIGSLDANKKTAASGGGTTKSFYLGDVTNNSSANVKVLVNPNLSQKTQWSGLSSTTPVKSARIANTNKAVYAVGAFAPTYNHDTNKDVGHVVTKLERALTHVESSETINVDILIDGGLSTIHANTSATNTSSAISIYNDAAYVETDDLSDETGYHGERWRTIFNIFDNFVSNTRKDCVFIADPLRQIFVNGEDVKTLSIRGNNFTSNIYTPLKKLLTGINSNYSTIYSNWLKTYDAFSDKFTWVPASGYVAAVYARTDSTTQPWIAPAGLNRGSIKNIVDIAFNPNQKQRDFLYTLSINPIVSFSGDGYVVFGQKTLQAKPSAFDRVNVRRLFVTLERAVQNSLKYFVFEPNTEFTRTRLRNTITPIFELAKNTEGLYDYLIVCDERNNVPDLIDRNELAVDIYIKPVKAAEFILVNFIATRTGQNFQELI